MNGKLPTSVAHMFRVERIGKVLRAHCKRCSYYIHFMGYPVTPLTHARLARHVDYHSDFGEFVSRNPEQLEPIAEDPPKT